jgi:hypothetical protein
MPDLSLLNPPETAPKDGEQLIAWAIRSDLGPQPVWCLVQWGPDYVGGEPFWRCLTPGYSSAVEILGWLPLPWSDVISRQALR